MIYIVTPIDFYNPCAKRSLFEYIHGLHNALLNNYEVTIVVYNERNFINNIETTETKLLGKYCNETIFDKCIEFYKKSECFVSGSDFEKFIYERDGDTLIFISSKLSLHLTNEKYSSIIKKNKCIVLNTEPYQRKHIHKDLTLLKNGFNVLEYYSGLKEILDPLTDYKNNILVVPCLYNPDDYIMKLDKEYKYDVCFITRYYEKCERRRVVIDRLKEVLKDRFIMISTWGDDRDNKIIQSRIVLNIHTSHLDDRETMRIDRLVHKKILVISDDLKSKTLYNDKFIIYAKHEDLFDKTIDVVNNYEKYYEETYKNYDIKLLELENEEYINKLNISK